MPNTLYIHLKSPWTREFKTDTAIFSSEIQLVDADGLLCDWTPDESLFSYTGPRAWYCCEPQVQFRNIERGRWPRIRSQLNDIHFLTHDHPNPVCKIPHITHFGELQVNRNLNRDRLAISIVSNHGGHPFRRAASLNHRNRFITDPLVDLYGRSNWAKYQRHWYSLPAFPKNYKGELPGDWHRDEKRNLMSTYRFAVCLENEPSPFYFTEKLVEAVCAGCVPIYQAHPTLKDNVLNGAAWLEPKNSISDTIKSCSESQIKAIQDQNNTWIVTNSYLKDTSITNVFKKIESYFRFTIYNT